MQQQSGSSRVVRAVVAVGSAALALGVSASSAGAAPSPAVRKAVAFIAAQQRSDGGFGQGEAGFAGFETPDAVLAIGAAAQTGSSWSATEARDAVGAVTTQGHSGLHYLDDWADGAFGAPGAGGAARTAIVAEALGLDPTAFDPDCDGATNLVATVLAGEGTDGTWGAGALNTTLTAVIALHVAGHAVDPATVAAIDAEQQANGSWNFGGDPSGTDTDPDTTGLAIQALVGAGVPVSDPAIAHALTFLATAQNADGSWSDAFSHTANPNSTALAMFGLRAADIDASTRAWRDQYAPSRSGQPYVAPASAILATQQSDGRFASPNDSFGINTFATSQGVEALTGFEPVATTADATCTAPPTTTTTVAPTTTVARPSTTVASQGSSSTTGTTTGSTTVGSTTAVGGAGTLPQTGSTSQHGMLVALALIGAGALLAFAGRRRSFAAR